MPTPPVIIVQLIHLEGPFKGQIQEYSDTVISIGRHPDCQLKFPTENNIISRKHADIIREGNRFKLIDHSSNGTLVNGHEAKEVYLKDGDVMTIARGGPKISFLTRISSEAVPPEITPSSAAPSQPAAPRPEPPVQQYQAPPPPPRPAQPSAPSPSGVQGQSPAPRVPVENVKATLIIQFGPTLRSFKELPVTIGKNPGCDFHLDHPGILDRHARILFHENQYWLQDLTGKKMITVNGQPFADEFQLRPNDELALGPQGPIFQFLGGGRLAEIEPRPAPVQPQGETQEAEKGGKESLSAEISKKAKSLFKKCLQR